MTYQFQAPTVRFDGSVELADGTTRNPDDLPVLELTGEAWCPKCHGLVEATNHGTHWTVKDCPTCYPLRTWTEAW